MLFQGVLLASVFSNEASKPYVELVICLVGIFISYYQIVASAKAKYWQEYWELKTSEMESELKTLIGEEKFYSLFDFDSSKSQEFKANVNRPLSKLPQLKIINRRN